MEKAENIRKIKICIVDDDIQYIDSLCYILNKYDNIWIYKICHSGIEFLNSVYKPFLPDICLIDLKLKDMSGIRCAKEIKARFPEMKVVIMTAYPDLDTISQAQEIGIHYIEKGPRTESMIENIITTFNDDNNPDNILLLKMTNDVESFGITKKINESRENLKLLSDTQITILKMRKENKSYKEIAEALNISEKTVQTHIYRAFKKLDLPDILDYILDSI